MSQTQSEELTCIGCYLTFEKWDISEGELTRCPRCESLVKV